jgi:uncharacterized membrane protein YoaK (UPF0700 family)
VSSDDDPAASLRGPLPRALLALTFVTGVVDAISFLALGQVFAAMMTGNILFLGFGIAGATGSSVAPPLVAVGAFVVGGGIGGFLASRNRNLPGQGLAVGMALEVALLAAGAIFAAAVTVREGEGSALILIATIALAMGARNTIIRRIGVPEMPTIVLSVAVASFEAGTSVTGASPQHLVPRLASVATMLLGAVCGALLLEIDLPVALGAAAGLSLATGIAYIVAGRPGRGDVT